MNKDLLPQAPDYTRVFDNSKKPPISKEVEAHIKRMIDSAIDKCKQCSSRDRD